KSSQTKSAMLPFRFAAHEMKLGLQSIGDSKMTANQCDIGLIGLAVMGENLVLNMESKGFTVAVFNRTTEVTEKFAASRAKGKNIQPTKTIEELLGALKKPKKVMIMIKAGKPVDQVIGELLPF